MATATGVSRGSDAPLTFSVVNGVRIAYADTGGAGDPLVLVHGSWGSHHNWDAVVPELARRFRVVAYDRRGHSAGDCPPGQGSFTDDVADLAALIEVGDHAGAAELFVDGVALGPGSWVRMPEAMRQVMTRNAPTDLDEARDPSVSTIDVEALAKFRGPTLITSGEQSPAIFGPVLDRLAELLPQTVRVTYSGAGHIPHVTHREEYVAEVLSFTQSAEGGPR